MLTTTTPLNQLLLQATLLEHLPAAIFVFILGSCVGSFLNVVIYRLPRGMRLLTPPSSCPNCNHTLRFFRENVPIIGWIAIRGRCRYCKAPVSIEYPLIEMLTGVLFLLLYVLCYWVSMRTPFFGDVFGPWWHDNGIIRTLPMFLALTTLLSGLIAMTIIDARTYTIPIQIPIFMTVVGVVAAGSQSFITMRHVPAQLWPLPSIDLTWTMAAIGGVVGVLVSTALLRLGMFKYSFADYEEYVRDDEPIADYPHARREMLKELLFVLPIIIGFMIGFVLGYEKGNPSPFMLGVGGSLLGYLIGGGLVWGIRIFGTLGFGREAMGLGDVHLLAGIGAILGCWDPVLIFFIAPFSGLLYAAVNAMLVKIGKNHREIPYGPHLAVATLMVLLCRPVVDWTLAKIAPNTAQQQTLQIDSHYDDLTNGVNVDSILITTTSRWNRSVKQDVLQARWLVL